MQLGMAIATFFCFFIGIHPDWLYRMLPFPVAYEPYSGYHISETMQIFAFTGLGFYLLAKKLKPEPVINLDLDWFYRKGTPVFMWFARKPVNSFNETVSNLYKTVGLRITMTGAQVLTWFDREGIDRVIDGSARGVVNGGDKVRLHITGRLQHISAALWWCCS
jgi:multicomponent Na+:H+ antiporter subunit D